MDNIHSGNVEEVGLEEIELDKIERNPQQPRVDFSSVPDLAESIKRNGLLQPIVVREVEKGKKYIIVAGERRFRAHKYLNKKTIKAKVIRCDDRTAYELTLLENVRRQDIDLIEEARGYEYLINKYGYKLRELKEIVGKSESSISNIIGILGEDERVKDYARRGILTLAMLVWIKQLPNVEEKLKLLKKIEDGEIKRKDFIVYVKRVVSAYRIANKLKLNPVEILKRTSLREGGHSRFDSTLSVPPDLLFHFIGEVKDMDDITIEFLPNRNLLYSAYGIMKSKTIAKSFAKVLVNRDKIDRMFLDCGAYRIIVKHDWGVLDQLPRFIEFYEDVQPDVSVSLDFPIYEESKKYWSVKKMIDTTIRNAVEFKEWKPSFKTAKAYVLQGDRPEEYLDMFYKLGEKGIWDDDSADLGICIGGMAKYKLDYQIEVAKRLIENKDFKKVREKLKFVHGFGVGSPERIRALYDYKINSFDSTAPLIVTSVGKYRFTLPENRFVHWSNIIEETPISRRIRFLWNLNAFWIELCKQFSDIVKDNKIITVEDGKIKEEDKSKIKLEEKGQLTLL